MYYSVGDRLVPSEFADFSRKSKAISQSIDPWSYASSEKVLLRSDDPVARDAVAGFVILTLLRNLEAPEKLANWPRSWKRDDDPPDMRRLGDDVFICTGIRRDLCCFTLWLRRRPNRIRRADESKRDDRSASRQAPFGSHVTVTSHSTGRSVTVRINDRGPFVKGRCIDLSTGAARVLGMAGTAMVSLH